ncbi:MAG: DUF4058 family protein [Gemmataceae bacterium]
MPLRDHFRSPLDDITSWEGFHGQWPAMIVLALGRRLPSRYVAAPRVHPGGTVEVDVGAFEKEAVERPNGIASEGPADSNGGVATAVWAPPRPTMTIATDLPDGDTYEVRVFDTRRGRRLVAAVEIVSPANKDRPEHRRAFVAKCLALLQQRVSVAIVDLVTTRHFNLYADLLEQIGHTDPSLGADPPHLYAAACRGIPNGDGWQLQTWAYPLTLGQPLPTLPLWLADDLAVPLELEDSYEQTCRALRIP